jgi:hypothetical protein
MSTSLPGRFLRSCAASAALAGLLLTAAQLRAQDEPEAPEAPPWLRVEVLRVDPSRVEEFMAVQRELSARAKDRNVPWRLVIRTVGFGDLYRFLVVTPLERLSGLDREATPDAERAVLTSRLEACLSEAKSYAYHTLPDIDNPPPMDQQPNLMVMNHVRVAPGREQEYLDLMTSEFFPHFDEQELHYVTGALALGGDGGFLHVFYIDDFAELDKGSPVMRALGPARAAEATAKLAGIVTSSELWVARALPELGFAPTPEASDER